MERDSEGNRYEEEEWEEEDEKEETAAIEYNHSKEKEGEKTSVSCLGAELSYGGGVKGVDLTYVRKDDEKVLK